MIEASPSTQQTTLGEKRRLAMRIVRTIVPILLLGAVLWTTNWPHLLKCTRAADPRLLVAAFSVYLAAVLVQGWRWHVLARSDGGHWPLWRMQRVNFVSMFFDSFTPGKLGSDAYRLATFRHTGRMHHLVVSLLALRLHGMAMSFVVAAVVGTIVLSFKHGWTRVALPAAVATALLIPVLMKSYSSIRKGTLHLKYNKRGLIQYAAAQLSKAHDAIKAMFSDPRTLHESNILALIYTLLLVTTYWLTGLAFGMTLPFQNYLAVVPLLILASVLPITIQGRGLTEVIAIGVWQGRRASQEQILLTCLSVFAIMVLQGLIGGVIWVVTRTRSGTDGQPEQTAK
ncbi:MAG: flippase-like domain-containing protein [Phycisphaerae bacterium]|nr:flippase-like domain-containing protein [Phycisphaerae bacterium]